MKPDAIAEYVIEALVIIAILWAVLTQYGCTPNIPSMKNDEIIAETKKCNDAGMRAKPRIDQMTFRIIAIECWPKREAQ